MRRLKRGHRRYFGEGPSHHGGFGPIAFQDSNGGGGGGGGGDGGGGGGTIDLSDPRVTEAITAAVQQATAGLQTKNTELLGEKAGLKERMDELSTQWAGLDPAAVRSLIEKFDTDEETKLIAEGKFDEVMAKRTEAMRSDWESKINAAAKKITELTEALSGRDGQIHMLRVDHAIRAACADSGISLSGAIEDAVALARSVFTINEAGELEARDGPEGALLMGKDGTTQLQPAEWLDGRKSDREFWWGTSGGGGAGGGSGDGGRDDNNVDGMSAREKLKAGMGG